MIAGCLCVRVKGYRSDGQAVTADRPQVPGRNTRSLLMDPSVFFGLLHLQVVSLIPFPFCLAFELPERFSQLKVLAVHVSIVPFVCDTPTSVTGRLGVGQNPDGRTVPRGLSIQRTSYRFWPTSPSF